MDVTSQYSKSKLNILKNITGDTFTLPYSATPYLSVVLTSFTFLKLNLSYTNLKQEKLFTNKYMCSSSFKTIRLYNYQCLKSETKYLMLILAFHTYLLHKAIPEKPFASNSWMERYGVLKLHLELENSE